MAPSKSPGTDRPICAQARHPVKPVSPPQLKGLPAELEKGTHDAGALLQLASD
jgi:hypothetical protein